MSKPLPTAFDFSTLFKPGTLEGQSPVKILGIRGALEPSGHSNDFLAYDDLICVQIGLGATPKAYRASTDPSKPLVQHPINPDGAAQLMPGLWWMQKHFLHGDLSKKCLGQSRDVLVARLDANGEPKTFERGQFGICIHSGGAGMGTGRFSAGCQIVQNEDGYFGQPTWNDFILPIRSAMDQFHLSEVPYLLIEGSGYTIS